ncbi:hypothetical protein [Anaerosporobacter sp.]
MQLRNRIKSMTGWIHATLLLAIIIPVLYALGMKQEKSIETVLYYKSLLILFPIIVTSVAINKCKKLINYIIICIITIAIVGLSAWLLGPVLTNNKLMWGYVIIIMFETIMVIVFRFTDRMHKIKSKETNMVNNPYWEPEYDLLNKPSILGNAIFVIVYLLCKNFDNPHMCNVALISSIIYLIVLILYKYIDNTEEYLSQNNTVRNVPIKRLYVISGNFLAIFILLLGISVIPSLLTINKRQYEDYRAWVLEREVDYSDLENEQSSKTTKDPFLEYVEEEGEPKEAPIWLNIFFYLLGSGIMVAIVIVIIKKIRENFHIFREAYDENGDIVEELKESEVVESKVDSDKNEVRNDSEREKIRRQYRKVIKKHRKEPPLGYETPLEIEIGAGIAETDEGKELHVRYEKARYGKI